MEIDELFGLPAHPLLVHMPVVFIPLTLLIAILAVAWSRGRKVLSVVAVAVAAVGMVGAQVAVMSGKALEERVRVTPLVRDHAELGEGARTLAILMFLAAVAYVAREWIGDVRLRGADRLRQALAPRVVGVVLSVALLTTAGLGTVWVVRAGHLGAKATWSRLPATATEAR